MKSAPVVMPQPNPLTLPHSSCLTNASNTPTATVAQRSSEAASEIGNPQAGYGNAPQSWNKGDVSPVEDSDNLANKVTWQPHQHHPRNGPQMSHNQHPASLAPDNKPEEEEDTADAGNREASPSNSTSLLGVW